MTDYERFRKQHPWLCWWVSLKFRAHLFLLRFGLDVWNDCGELVPWGEGDDDEDGVPPS